MPSTINSSGSLQPPEGGTINYAPPAVYNVNNVGGVLSIAMTTSPLGVPVPPNAIAFGLALPPNNTGGVSVYGASGQAAGAIGVHPTLGIPCMCIPPGQSELYFVSTTPVAGVLTFG
jgi:hypothetical protein